MLFRLGLDVVADDLEKRVGQRKGRVGDETLGFCRVGVGSIAGGVGGCCCVGVAAIPAIAFRFFGVRGAANEGERQGGQAKELCDTFHVNLKA